MTATNNSSTAKKTTRFWLIVCLLVVTASIALHKVYRHGLNDGSALAHKIIK